MRYGKLGVFIGGVLAIVGQFWGSMYYLPLIGGILAIVSSFAITEAS